MEVSVTTELYSTQIVAFDISSGRKRRGTAPARYVKASSAVHRNILQQLEKMTLIEPDLENG